LDRKKPSALWTWPQRLAELSIRRPVPFLVVPLLVSLAMAPGLARLELRTDGRSLVPPNDPAVAIDAEVRERFGLRDPIVVLIESPRPEGIYHAATLRSLQRISDAVARIEGIGPRNVVSLATEHRDRFLPGTLRRRTYLTPLPDTPELLAELRSDLEAAGIFYGTLVSRDGHAAAILAGVPAAAAGRDRTELYRQIAAKARREAARGDRISVVGAPAAEALLGVHVAEDLATLLPLTIAMIAGVVWIGCRRLWGVALALVKVAAALVWTLGLMGWIGAPVYLPTAVLPVILTALGLADEIHIFWEYQQVLGGEEGAAAPSGALRETMRRLAVPVALTSVTTAIGFLSFLTSSIVAVRSFGLFAALGMLFCMLWSLTATTAATAGLALLAPGAMRRPAPAIGARRARAGRAASSLLGRPRSVLAALGLVTAGLGLGVFRLAVQDSWIQGFSPESDFRQASERADAQFHGTHILLAHLRFSGGRASREGAGPLLDPRVLAAVGDFESFLRGRPGVGGALGLHSYLEAANFLGLGRREEARGMVDTAERIRHSVLRLEIARGRDRRREVVDDGMKSTIVTVFLRGANYRDTAALIKDIRRWEGRHLAPLGGRVELAGDVAVSQAMIPAIVRSQVSSLLVALLGTLLAIAFLYRSAATGLLALLPACAAVLWVFGGMGWAGVPLGVATSMFCAISLGVAVDFAIHFIERYRLRGAGGPGDAARRAFVETGPGIAADALAVSLGFGLLAVSRVPPNAYLGLLVAAALLSGAVLTLAGLGSLLAVRDQPKTPGPRADSGTRRG
jgi:predicted RND superfamily exporter protein